MRGRVRERQVETPSAAKAPKAELWRAEAQQALTIALNDADDDIASGAAIALGMAGDPGDAAPLVSLVLDVRRGQQVREGAALALGFLPVEQGGDATRQALEAVASDDHSPERLRGFSVYALGLRGEIVATDITRSSPAFHTADAGVIVPKADAPDYIPALLEHLPVA